MMTTTFAIIQVLDMQKMEMKVSICDADRGNCFDGPLMALYCYNIVATVRTVMNLCTVMFRLMLGIGELSPVIRWKLHSHGFS